MPSAPDFQFLEWWFQALHEPVGIILTSNNRVVLMNKLYAARKAYTQDDSLQALSICVSPTDPTELWIVHKTVRIDADDGREAETPEAHA